MSAHNAQFRMASGSAASAAELPRAVLPVAQLACIKWGTLQQGSERFLDRALGLQDADLAFTALKIAGINLHVYVVEHTSRRGAIARAPTTPPPRPRHRTRQAPHTHFQATLSKALLTR